MSGIFFDLKRLIELIAVLAAAVIWVAFGYAWTLEYDEDINLAVFSLLASLIYTIALTAVLIWRRYKNQQRSLILKLCLLFANPLIIIILFIIAITFR